ncbi:uncharacterized protein LOC127101956 [Lathyrus oleraceus]|uniref:uncharacterized protein LOC127101956 n=1 Tax=Pisum sativum TaxID=3888 RepID=UPI0021D0C862|nr:uncharacterized protein LOC127101956 [Pisum sativum]
MDISTRKITFTFRFKSPDISSLKLPGSKVTTLMDNKFRASFGNIIDLLTEKVDYGVITIMDQYYDVPLICFTFPDFQISPTLEDLERLLNRSIKEYNPFPKLVEGFCLTELSLALGINSSKLVANWGIKGPIKGLTQKFLEAYAWEMLKEGIPNFFSATLSLFIHGIVLFPNIDKFVNHLAVKVFLTNNSVSFLLVDFYHTFHTRHEKKGYSFLYCAPLLHLLMRDRIPQHGPFAQSTLTWPQKFASLSANSIPWYKREWDTKEVIARCEGFPNVALIGTQGCINYNPTILKIELGYAILSPPEERDFIPFVVNTVDPLNSNMKRVQKAWINIVCIDQEWGKKNILAKEPYFVWVKERARVVKISFLFYPSSFPLMPEPSLSYKRTLTSLPAKSKSLSWRIINYESNSIVPRNVTMSWKIRVNKFMKSSRITRRSSE